MRVLYKGLWVSELYKMMSFGIKIKICNGCGPRGFWSCVPETFYGLKMTSACNCHDFDYFEGDTLKDKERSDRWALVNWNRIIKKNTKYKWLKRLRQRRAKTYYHFISKFGYSYFLKKDKLPT